MLYKYAHAQFSFFAACVAFEEQGFLVLCTKHRQNEWLSNVVWRFGEILRRI